MTEFSSDETLRYARQLSLAEVGPLGQAKLRKARVLIVGLGGLGSPAAMYLAASGVGTIGLCDGDTVSVTNLHRQILHNTASVGNLKTDSACQTLSAINPYIQLQPLSFFLDKNNVVNLIKAYDVVVDGSDNFQTRYLLNDACYFENKPLVSAAIMGFEGQLSVFFTKEGPCYRCLFPEPPPAGFAPSCAELGVLGVLPGVVGCFQATEALKIILGIGQSIQGALLSYNALDMEWRRLEFTKNPECGLCGPSRQIQGVSPINTAEQCQSPQVGIGVQELAAALKSNEVTLVDVRSDFERRICLIQPSMHIPLDQLESKLDQLPAYKPLIFYCKSGIRSSQAVALLAKHHRGSRSLVGGILSWIEYIDSSLERY